MLRHALNHDLDIAAATHYGGRREVAYRHTQDTEPARRLGAARRADWWEPGEIVDSANLCPLDGLHGTKLSVYMWG